MNSKGEIRHAGRARPTIGLLGLLGGFWIRAAAMARKWDANLIGFSCGELRSPNGFEAQANVLTDLVGAENVDGLVIWSDYLGHYVTPEELRVFCNQYRPLPTVSVGPVEGIPSILVDNYQGMYEAVVHLIEAHGHRRIACIRGPEGNVEAEQRYQAYVDALTAHGMSLDKDLVAISDFSELSAVAAMNLLLDERRSDFQALVTFTDAAAFTAIEILRRRGTRVPEDVAVVGFDDEGDNFTPPLTSVYAQWYEAGSVATEMVLKLLAGEEIPEKVLLSSRLVVRQSCGCPSAAVAQAAAGIVPAGDETPAAAFSTRREEILAAMVQAAGDSIANLAPGLVTLNVGHFTQRRMKAAEDSSVNPGPKWMERLLDVFAAELTESTAPGAFISTLDDMLRQVTAADGDAAAWQRIISALRRHALPCLADARDLSRAEDLWQQARVMIGETARQVQARSRGQSLQQAHTLRQVGQALNAATHLTELKDALVRELSRLGISSCYLSLYEEPKTPAEWAWMILAYDEGGCIELEEGERRFPARQLAPPGLLPQSKRRDLKVESLCFREEQLGFVILEPGPTDAMTCAALREQISYALKAALLTQERERAEEETEQLKEFNEGIVQTMSEGIAVEDSEGFFTFVNPALATMLGYTPAELTGKHWTTITPPDQQSIIQAADEQRVQNEAGHYAVELVRKDGTRFPAMVSGIPRFEGGRFAGTLAVCMDITDRKRAEEALERHASQLALINDIGGKVAAVLELDSVLSRAARLVQESFGYHHVALFIVNREQGELMMKTRAGDFASLYPPDHRLKLDQGMVGWAGRHGETLLSNDVRANPRYVNLYPDAIPTQSELSVPIRVGEEVVGVLDIQSPQLDAFDENTVMVIETLADQIAAAIENARLFEEARSRAEELAALNELGRALTTRLSVDEVLNEAYRQASRLLDTTNFGIVLYDPEKNELRFAMQVTESEIDKTLTTIPADRGMSGYIVRNHASVLIRGNLSEWQKETGVEMVGQSALSWLGVPLIVGGRVLGVIVVQSFTNPHAYGEHDRDMLTAIASQTAIALQNAYLFEETRSRAQRLAVVNRIAKVASATLDLDDLMQRVYEEVAPAFQPDAFFVTLYDEETNELDFHFVIDDGVQQPPTRVPLGIGYASRVVTEKKPLVIRDVAQEEARLPPAWKSGTMKHPKSWLGVPLLVGERVIGVINVQSYRPNVWDEEDELLLFTIADQVAVGIENAKLYEAVQQELVVRKQAEEALARQAEELARSNAELKQFFYVSSHHLQEPLRMVATYLQFLEQRYKGKLDTDADEFIDYAVGGARRMQELINDQLAYARVGARGKAFEPTDCSAVLDQALANLQVAVEESGAVVTRDGLPTVMADRKQLVQLFQNLVDNAIKFRGDLAPAIHVGAERTDGQWVFSVSDNGIGIEAQYFERIFLIFQRLHTGAEYPGTGIGLPICRKIVELHGGRIWVESEPGQGSTFYFTIPDKGGDV